MNAKTLAEQALDKAREYKQHTWGDHHMRDAPPQMAFYLRDFGVFDTHFAELDLQVQRLKLLPPELINNEGYFPTLARFVYQQLRDGNLAEGFDPAPAADDRLEAFVCVSDAYLGDEAEASITGESLEEDFKSNPDSKVTEGMIVFVGADDLVGGADVAILCQPYTISDGGELSWGVPKDTLPGGEGADDHPFTQLARDIFRAQGVV